MLNMITVILAGAVGLVILSRYLVSPADVREPTTIQPSIPYVGHIINMIRYKTLYYTMLRDKHDLPILTLPLPGSKMYVVIAPHLVKAVQKLSKVISFRPFEVQFVIKVTGCSTWTRDLIAENASEEEGKWGYSATFFDLHRQTLYPGQGLDAMSRVMVQNISESCSKLSLGTTRFNLHRWLRHEITRATSGAVWGLDNPFEREEVEKAFWRFESDLGSLLFGVVPWITAKGTLNARRLASVAFEEYYKNGGQLKGSALAQMRFNHSTKYGVPVSDIAKIELGKGLAVLSNTYPAVFWAIIHLFSNPVALNDCRQELDSVVATTVDENGNTHRALDITDIKTSCPITVSAMQETLRLRSVIASAREVLQDTDLDGQYALKKGYTIIIPSHTIHSDTSTWGDDARDFNHERFLKNDKAKRVNPTAFRFFGGGQTLCPGRHFAMNEILAIVAVMIMRFDMAPADGGPWPAVKENIKLWSAITDPDESIDVQVSSRSCWGPHDIWDIDVSSSDVRVGLTAEDMS